MQQDWEASVIGGATGPGRKIRLFYRKKIFNASNDLAYHPGLVSSPSVDGSPLEKFLFSFKSHRKTPNPRNLKLIS